MQLEQSFTLAADPALVWQAFHDVRLLVDCLPGASIKPDADTSLTSEIPLLFKVKLGPISAGFTGQGQLVLDEAAQRGSFTGKAVDARTNSRVKGEAAIAIFPHAAGTQVNLTVDFSIAGSLAQFSREGIVRALAEQLTQQFATNLQTSLSQPAEGDADASGVSTPSTDVDARAPVPAAPAEAVNPTHSEIDLWSLLKAWLRGLFVRSRS